VNTLWNDIRYGLRVLLKNPGFTAIAIFSLALGIGANTTIFSVVDALLLKSLPYKDPNSIILVWGTDRSTGEDRGQVSFTDAEDWRAQNHVFEELATYTDWKPLLSGLGEAERIHAMLVSDGYFRVMKGKPLLGRLFLPEEQVEGKDFVAILNYGLWQRRFGGDPNIVGKTIHLNARPYNVVGVLGPDFHSLPASLVGELAELYRPVAEAYGENQRGSRHLRAIARIKPGVSVEKAQADMSTIARRIENQHLADNTNYGVRLVTLTEDTLGLLRKAILLVFGAVGCLLLIACANVANLLLARTTARQKEVAIRLSMGANRIQLIRQFLVESTLMALTAGILGIVFAMWGNSLIEGLGERIFPLLIGIKISWKVLAFTLSLALITGILFGIVPALYASRSDLTETLKEGGRTSATISHQRARSALVISEVALAIILLTCSGLMIRTVISLRSIHPGFNPENILSMSVWLPRGKYAEEPERLAFFSGLLDRIRAIPGVRSAGAVHVLPLSGDFDGRSIEVDGQPVPLGQEPEVDFYVATPGYREAMDIPLLKGRFFNSMDQEKTEKVAVVSQTFAAKFWPNQDPIGKRIRMESTPEEQNPWYTVVGMVGDVKQMGLDTGRTNQMYFSMSQFGGSAMSVLVRTASDPTKITSAVQKEIRAMDKDQAAFDVKTMNQVVSNSISLKTFSMILLTTFAALALILSAVGIYGVISYSVAQRTHEIGIRMALGARETDVLRMVVRRGLILALIGIAIGSTAAIAIGRLMTSFLFEVTPTDPVTYLTIGILLASVAVLASYFPARKASRVDPMVALRYE
jgi:putative ABC transport system permease protein